MHDLHPARRLWLAVEPIHAVTYFADQCRADAAALGLKGFWMGYFAFRSAPLGPVGPAPVRALFAGFRPAMVARALPDAWGFASPEACVAERARSAAGVLRSVGVDAGAASRAAELLAPAVDGLDLTGRPLAAANAALPLPSDPVERLWQLATTLREHRGDGHVAALVAAGLSGLDAHLLQVAAGEAMWGARGWTDEERSEAEESLRARGLLAGDGTVSDAGAARRASVERRTDEAAWGGGWDALDADAVVAVLAPMAKAAESVLVFPNPMGLPAAG